MAYIEGVDYTTIPSNKNIKNIPAGTGATGSTGGLGAAAIGVSTQIGEQPEVNLTRYKAPSNSAIVTPSKPTVAKDEFGLTTTTWADGSKKIVSKDGKNYQYVDPKGTKSAWIPIGTSVAAGNAAVKKKQDAEYKAKMDALKIEKLQKGLPLATGKTTTPTTLKKGLPLATSKKPLIAPDINKKNESSWKTTWTGDDGREIQENKKTGKYRYKGSDGNWYNGTIGDKVNWEAKINKYTPADVKDPFASEEAGLTEEAKKNLLDIKNEETTNLENEQKNTASALSSIKAAIENFNAESAKSLQGDFDTYKKEQETLLSGLEATKLRGIQAKARQILAVSGANAFNMSPEFLIAKGDTITSDALDQMFQAKQKMITDVGEKKLKLGEALRGLKEKGMLANNDYQLKITELNSNAAKEITRIKKDYITSLTGVKEKDLANRKTASNEVINTINNWGAAAGLTGTQLEALSPFINAGYTSGAQALQAISKALQDKTSLVYQYLKKNADVAAAAAQSEAETKRLAAQKSATGTPTSYKGETQSYINDLLLEKYPDAPVSAVKTVDDWKVLGPWLKKKNPTDYNDIYQKLFKLSQGDNTVPA